MWGIIPAAGMGSRIQPLAFSKELLPVGSKIENGRERPRAVSEYLVERMLCAGVQKLCFVIAPGKHDIVNYYGEMAAAYVVQSEPRGLCDSIFRALPFLPRNEEPVLVGLPDTVWFPDSGFCSLPDDVLSFLLFPVETPELFDAVVTDSHANVLEIQVKRPEASSRWVWGAFKMPARTLHELRELWLERGLRDEYIGTLVNAWLRRGGQALGIRAGERYFDVGTLDGYRLASEYLTRVQPHVLAPKAS